MIISAVVTPDLDEKKIEKLTEMLHEHQLLWNPDRECCEIKHKETATDFAGVHFPLASIHSEMSSNQCEVL
jgi:hypothetical protein